MIYVYLNKLKWLFPSYWFWYFNFLCLKGLFLNYVWSILKRDFIVTRKEQFFSKISIFLLVFYYLWFYIPYSIGRLGVSGSINQYLNLSPAFVSGFSKFVFLVDYYKWYTFVFILFDELLFKKIVDCFKNEQFKQSPKDKLRNKAIRKNKVFFGTNMKTGQPIFIDCDSRLLHTAAVGASGSGKTESFIFPMVYQDMLSGRGAIVIEAKGNIDFYRKFYTLYKMNNKHGQKTFICDLSNAARSYTYNPLLRGNPTEIKDRIMGSFEWSEIYYKERSESILYLILVAVEAAGKLMTFNDLYLLLTEKAAQTYLFSLIPEKSEYDLLRLNFYTKIVKGEKELAKDCSGLISKIFMLTQGEVSQILDTYDPDIDLLDVYQNNSLVYFSLPTNLIGETAQAFGKMLLMDLKSTAGYIETGLAKKSFFPVFIDEFAEFASLPFVSWINKARSAGMAIHLAFQSLGDIKALGDAFVTQIIDNCTTKIVFMVHDATTAETFSKQLGTIKEVKETVRVEKTFLRQKEGLEGSLRDVESFIVHPNDLKTLNIGECLIFGKRPKAYYSMTKTDYLPNPEEYFDLNTDDRKIPDDSKGLNLKYLIMQQTIDTDFLDHDKKGSSKRKVDKKSDDNDDHEVFQGENLSFSDDDLSGIDSELNVDEMIEHEELLDYAETLDNDNDDNSNDDYESLI